MLYFLVKKNSFSFLIGIFGATILGLVFGVVKPPNEYFSMPDFKSVMF
jgi:hypothetical protein